MDREESSFGRCTEGKEIFGCDPDSPLGFPAESISERSGDNSQTPEEGPSSGRKDSRPESDGARMPGGGQEAPLGESPEAPFRPEAASIGAQAWPTAGNVVWMAFWVEGGLVLGAAVLGWLLGHLPWTKVHWNMEDAVWGVLMTGPLWVGLMLGLWLGERYPWRPWQTLVQQLETWVIPLFRPCRVWQLAVISLLAGVGEEMFFRGVLQDAAVQGVSSLLGQEVGVWVAVGAVSALFGLLHWISPLYALLAGLIGAYLGWWRIQSGNLLGPIVAHALYDFVALVYLTKFWRRG